MEALHPDVSEVVLSEEDIKDIVARMGAEITEDYKDKNPLIVAVLKGAVVFTADIMRAIDCPIAIDFMAVSSYGDGAKSSGVVRIVKDLEGKKPAVHPQYVGSHVPDEFIVGYGLDFAERYRNLPYIGILKPEVYS